MGSEAEGDHLRVLQVMECTIGGTRRHLTDLCHGLLDRGVDLHVCAAAERQPDFRDDLAALRERGATIHELPMVRSISPGRDARQVLQLSALLRRVQPDIVHTHSSKAGVLGRLASEVTEVGVRVHTPHTFAFLFEDLFGARKRRLFYELEKRLAANCARVIAVGRDEARGFVESGVVSEDRLAVIENGIDPGPWLGAQPLDVAAFGFDPSRPLLLCAGLLYAAKGQDLLLQALARPGNEDWQCAFAGSGPDAESLRAEADELGVADRVRWLGFRRDLPSWMASCDALALPSRWEGLPYVVLEAGASGKPVVATPVDGARALVDAETGWRAAEVSLDAFAAALADCLRSGPEARAARGVAARSKVLAEHGVARMVDRHLELYREVA